MRGVGGALTKKEYLGIDYGKLGACISRTIYYVPFDTSDEELARLRKQHIDALFVRMKKVEDL